MFFFNYIAFYAIKLILWSNFSYHFFIVLDFKKTALLDICCASYIHPSQQTDNMYHKPLVISAFLPQVLLLLRIQNPFFVSEFWRHLQYERQYNTTSKDSNTSNTTKLKICFKKKMSLKYVISKYCFLDSYKSIILP